MYNSYDEFLLKFKEPPLWHDEHGVPRWISFHPKHVNNIYADEVALIHIKCQYCGRDFAVAVVWCGYDRVNVYTDGVITVDQRPRLSKFIEYIRYGDAPCYSVEDGEVVGCTGTSMTSEPIKILEFWKRSEWEWKRFPELEVKLECEWRRENA